ncbi:ABC transporter permease [Paenibacillus wynnii]|uniref:Transport permease protein n=1 Tax=Paenibacillus wynnii TaxID=268407 RepID=A0A098M4N8_9BACL|nr:ABC transporter permease [Paenibacillus wynnii]KGE16517.1 hypothetical protein PWYN_17460 [Paenibacillus wynnii]
MNSIFLRFVRQSVISYKALYGIMDIKTFILIKLINPLFQITFFVLLTRYIYNTDDLSPWVISNAILLSCSNALFGVGFIMIQERRFGTLKLVLITPANKFFVYIGRTFIHVVDAILTVGFGLLFGYVAFGVQFNNTNPLALIVALLITVFASVGFGLMLGSVGTIIPDLNLVMNFCYFLLLILSGAQFPISQLPDILQKVSYVIPLTRGIEAVRLIVQGARIIDVSSLLIGELFLGIIFFIAGYFFMRLFEKISIVRASLDIY